MTANNGSAGTDGKELAALLTEQRDLYRQLSRLSEKQRGLITGGQPERLLTLLAERQQLIDQLEAISRRLRPYQADWRTTRESLSTQEGERVDGLVAEIKVLLADILKKDEADTALLSARKGQTGKAIGALQTGRQAGRAYMASSVAHSTGMDWTQA